MGILLVTGARGMLGRAVVAAAPGAVRGIDLEDGDLSEPGVAARLIAKATGVIHCAGYTDVDGAESEPEAAHRANAVASAMVAEACSEAGIPLVIVSTDYVFDGTATHPYTEEDTPNPQGVYGRSKLAAEQPSARIVRTAWLHGEGGRNFPDTILRLAAEGPLRVVNDQRGSPTWTGALAPVLWDVLRLPVGIYHATCEGSCTWYEFARFIAPDADISPCTSAEFPRPAPRPAYSVLDCSKLAALRGKRLPHWQEAYSVGRGNSGRTMSGGGA
ncbi:MAG: dTDP-4-dehydrorhamnose reductase [Planctomycetota bacterium]|jgi:dTDP-4-dehydrorhamnose reductase